MFFKITLKAKILTKIPLVLLFIGLITVGFGTNYALGDIMTPLGSLSGVPSDMAIGTDGFPMIAYSQGGGNPTFGLWVVHCKNPSCSSFDPPTVLDDGEDGIEDLSIAIGSDGLPIISYFHQDDSVGDDLKLIHCTNISCSSFDAPVFLDTEGGSGRENSIAIGSDGFPIISYLGKTPPIAPFDRPLKTIHCTNISCSSFDAPVTLDDTLNVITTSISVGTDNLSIISYGTDSYLKTIHCTNISCSSFDAPVTLDAGATSFNAGDYISMMIGSDGFPIISYHDEEDRVLKLVHCANPSCSLFNSPTTLVSPGPQDIGKHNSIAMAVDGNPIISYYDNNGKDLKSIHCTNIFCSSADDPITLDNAVFSAHTSIAIGNDGLPIILYLYNGLKVLHCTNIYCNGFNPSFSFNHPVTLQTEGDVGENTSITIGDDGLPRIASMGIAQGNMSYNRCATPDCSSFDEAEIPLDDSTTSHYTLEYLSTVGFEDEFLIFYYDDGDLLKRHCHIINFFGCDVRVFPSFLVDEGQYPSSALGTDGFAFVSYYDATNGSLKALHCTNVICSANDAPVTLDNSADVGMFSSTQIGSDGFPIISYYDSTNGNLKAIHCSNVSCSSFTVVVLDNSANDVGQSNSITIGSDGFPIISYLDATIFDLKAVHCNSTLCNAPDSPVTLDNDGAVGQHTSITIGNDGFPIISYFDAFPNFDLKAVHCSNISCSTVDTPITLDSNGNVGQYTSIAIGKNNLPIISYHDETNGDLKIITQNESCAPIGSGDWVIGSDCSLITSLTIPNGNILVENNSQLTIHPGVTLDVDFLNHHLMINLGSNIVIKSGGAIT